MCALASGYACRIEALPERRRSTGARGGARPHLQHRQAAHEQRVVGRDAELELVHGAAQVAAELGEGHVRHAARQRRAEHGCAAARGAVSASLLSAARAVRRCRGPCTWPAARVSHTRAGQRQIPSVSPDVRARSSIETLRTRPLQTRETGSVSGTNASLLCDGRELHLRCSLKARQGPG